MYIEFQLPLGGGGGGAQHRNWIIRDELEDWSQQYQIQYTAKNVKYTLRVTFDDETLYSVFAMTWQGSKYRLIETLVFDKY